MRKLTLLLVLAVGCSGQISDLPLIRPGQARLSLALMATNAVPTGQLAAPELKGAKEINVTIDRVTAHSAEGGWVEIFSGKVTVDLLSLKTQGMFLGFQDLPPGKITQLRLYTDPTGIQNVMLATGELVPLKVPSGVQSGIKIKGPFELSACNVTNVTLDFEGHKSIWAHPTGSGEDWILRPVIHTRKVHGEPGECATPGGPTGPGGPIDPNSTPISPTNPNSTPIDPFEEGGGNTTPTSPTSPTSPSTTLQPPFEEGGAGTPCSSASQCLSNVCQSGLCGVGGPGSACELSTDCSSLSCGLDGLCGSGTANGVGSSCSQNSQCLSNTCVAGVCEVGSQGTPCNTINDCAAGFACELGSCSPVIN